MHDHVDASELEELVIGALAGERLERIEQHVASCEECAARLAREARLEVMLAEVQAAAPAPRPRRRIAAAIWAAPVVAIAIVIVLAVRRGDPTSDRGQLGRASVVCSDGPEQLACIDEAHHHGLFVQYPGWAGAPPFGDRAPGTGPSRSPFEERRP